MSTYSATLLEKINPLIVDFLADLELFFRNVDIVHPQSSVSAIEVIIKTAKLDLSTFSFMPTPQDMKYTEDPTRET